MQALTRNPLADSGILGINAGAAFAVVVTVFLLRVSSLGVCAMAGMFGAAVAGGSQQIERVGVFGILENVQHTTVIHDFAHVHRGDFICQLCKNAKIMRDEHDSQAGLRLNFFDELAHLRLDRHIEGGGRFIGD